jgi:prepilin-type N-terminal cleavage/methylation domain-containing protein
MVQRQRRRGYTLVEVTLVLALMVILAAIGYPSVDAMLAGVKADGAADAVRAAWSEAQAHAINEGRPYRFAFVPGKGNFRVAPASDEYWNGASPSADPDNPAYACDGTLPKGVVFRVDGSGAPAGDGDTSLPEGSVSAGQWDHDHFAVFLPDGTAQDDVDLTLELASARPVVVHLRALTGVVTVERGE